MLTGLTGGIDRLASLAVFLSFTALSLFFLLKDSPTIGGWVERHVGLPVPLAHAMLGRIASSLRGYFLGVTIVAAWSALIVGIGAAAAGGAAGGDDRRGHLPRRLHPLPRRLGRGRLRGADRPRRVGPETAIALAVVILLANGIFQQLVQPVAYGAALGLHPLAVLIVTIGGRRPVRDDRADPRRAADLGRGADLRRHRRRTRRGRGGLPSPACRVTYVSHVSTTEFAEVGVERAAGLGFQHWAAVRRCALGPLPRRAGRLERDLRDPGPARAGDRLGLRRARLRLDRPRPAPDPAAGRSTGCRSSRSSSPTTSPAAPPTRSGSAPTSTR